MFSHGNLQKETSRAIDRELIFFGDINLMLST